MKKHIITALATLLTAAAASAQISQARQFEINREALRILSDYERTAELRDNNAAYEFRELFGNGQLRIFNDLIGISTDEKLTVGDYVSLLKGFAKTPRVTLSNVRHLRTWQEPDGMQYTRLAFDKNINYSNSCGAILNAAAYYGKPYACEMTIAINPATGETRIASLEGRIPDGKSRLAPGFSFVDYTSPTDTLVLANGEPMKFNFQQALVERDTKFSIKMDTHRLKVKKFGVAPCIKYKLAIVPLKFRVKPYIDITIGNQPYEVELPSQINVSQNASNFGVDFGYMFVNRKNFRMGVFTGAGYSTGSIGMTLPSLEYNYETPRWADIDDEAYRRYVSLEDVHQSIDLKAFSVPAYLELVYAAHTYINFYLDLGVKAYFNAGSKASDISGKTKAYGIYPQYGNLLIDAPYMNDFGVQYETSNSNLHEANFNAVSLDAMGGLGIRIKLFGPLMLDAGVRYGMAVTPFIKADNPLRLMEGSLTSEQQALATYQAGEGKGTTTIKTFTDSYLGNVKRNGLKLHAGLVLKF